MSQRKTHEDSLNELISTWTADHAANEIMTILQRAGVDASVVRTMGEAVEACPQFAYRKYWRTTEHPELGTVITPGSSYLMSKTPYKIERPAPCFGEHTEYVCTKLLNMSDNEFIQLFNEGVFQ